MERKKKTVGDGNGAVACRVGRRGEPVVEPQAFLFPKSGEERTK